MFRTLLISTCIICSAVSADTPVVYEDFKLLASDGVEGDRFGNSVAISNDIVIVGAYADDDDGHYSGSAYIYRFDGKNWNETKITASDAGVSDEFGISVSISGDTIVVGAFQNDDNGTNSGSAYIYRFDGKNWNETKLTASDAAEWDLFGISVCISSDGSTAIVGAYGDDDNGTYSGSAYIYSLVKGTWEETKLTASDGASSDFFGHSVATSGDTIVVGANGDDDNGVDSGSAYVYRFDGSSWIETKLLPSDGGVSNEFGISVSTSGDTVVVGAQYDDDNGSSSGSAYIYRFDGTSWVETKLLPSDGEYRDHFGSSVSISSDGTTALVGAREDDSDNGNSSGSAYIFYSVDFDDSDSDGVPDDIDNCYLYNPDQADCNENGIGDVCDVADGTSYDCDQNLVPDECQPDCDGDGNIDPCDNDGDCDDDGIPDNCETDCQPNGIPDDCDIILGISEDVNEDGIPDECQDCNKNGIPDPVDIADGTSEDSDGNGIPDECQYPDTWTVDDDGKADFDNIQEAVGAAGFFDEIVVYPGTYPAGINMLGKEIWLHSSDGPEVTIIDGEETLFGIVCESGETYDTIIEGFTISNCNGGWQGGGMSISRDNSGSHEPRATVLNCIFDSNVSDGFGGGMYVYNGSVNISGCLFVNNRGSQGTQGNYAGGGVFTYGGNVVIVDTRFCDNWPNAITGEWTDGGGTCIAFSCNDSDGDGVPDECGTVDDGVHYVPEEYATIQEAILAAGDHDEIIVGPGTYSECSLVIPEHIVVTIINPLGKRLWIHSRDGPEYTILDGACAGTWSFGGETLETIIEGFTFDVSYPSSSARTFLSSPTFKNCIFTHGSPGVLVRGISPEFENCTFINNGNGIEFNDFYGNPKLTNCIFSNAAKLGWGGLAIATRSAYDVEVVGSQFVSISGDNTGLPFGPTVIDHRASGNLSLTDCLFKNNGVMFYDGYVINAYSGNTFSIHGCTFIDNYYGGINAATSSSRVSDIVDSVFINNSGGGLNFYFGNTSITNTTICSNGGYQILGGWIDGGGNTIEEVCSDDCNAADLTNDGIVDVNDLLAVLEYWGTLIPGGDVNWDGSVDVTDLLIVVGNWGPCE